MTGTLPNTQIDFLPARKWSWPATIGAWFITAFAVIAVEAFTGASWVHTAELAGHGIRTNARVVTLELYNHGGCKYAYSRAESVAV